VPGPRQHRSQVPPVTRNQDPHAHPQPRGTRRKLALNKTSTTRPLIHAAPRQPHLGKATGLAQPLGRHVLGHPATATGQLAIDAVEYPAHADYGTWLQEPAAAAGFCRAWACLGEPR
jgi:hypothetical protein